MTHYSIDPHICRGEACIRGTRLPVHQIVRMLANGDTVEDLLAEYPAITREDILACLGYAGRWPRRKSPRLTCWRAQPEAPLLKWEMTQSAGGKTSAQEPHSFRR